MHNDAIAQRHHCIMMQPCPVAGAGLFVAPEVSDDRRSACIKMQICTRSIGVNGHAGYDVRPGSRPSGPICNCILPGGTPGADASSTGALHWPADAYLHKGRAVPRTVYPAVDWSGAGQGSAKRDRWKPCLCWPEPFPSGPLRHACIIASSEGRQRAMAPRSAPLPRACAIASLRKRRPPPRRPAATIGPTKPLRICINAQGPKPRASGCHGRPGSRPMQLHH